MKFLQPKNQQLVKSEVIDLNEVKTFNLSDVSVLEVGESRFTPDVKITFNNPIPVWNSKNEVIGFANLDLTKHEVTADIFIEYSTPERLDIELGKLETNLRATKFERQEDGRASAVELDGLWII